MIMILYCSTSTTTVPVMMSSERISHCQLVNKKSDELYISPYSMPSEHSNQQMYKQTLDAGEADIS